MNRTVYTIGHGTSGFTDLAERLERNHVTTIVDVRSQPYSRHAPDFQKLRLAVHAAAAGFGYRWMGDRLGGRPADPALLDPEGRANYDAIRRSPGFEGALEEIDGLLHTGPVVLLCAETDPTHCHRSRLLAPALEARGIHVYHILGDGTVEAHQRDLGL